MNDNNSYGNSKVEIDCTDIYAKVFSAEIKLLKRFKERWVSSYNNKWDKELFQYADPDFYFYRFNIERTEKNTEAIVVDILYSLMERYGLSFDVPCEKKNAPFTFILYDGNKKLGFRFSDFYEDEDVNTILKKYKVDRAYIIRLQKPSVAEKYIISENKNCKERGINLRIILLSTFFEIYFGKDEYKVFNQKLEEYLKECKDIIGYKPIKFLSNSNLSTQKLFEEKLLRDWDYKNYRFKILDEGSEDVKDYLHVSNYQFDKEIIKDMYEQYVTNEIFKTMVGSNDYAESFITSEWLFHSLKEKKNFDYTSIINGYLKSVEQLLYSIVMMNVDKNCKISMSKKNKVKDEVINKNIPTYGYNEKLNTWKPINVRIRVLDKYIDFTNDNLKYMDSSIGTFEHFLRKNPKVLRYPQMSKSVADMIACFRKECRNKYLHLENIKEWDIVKTTRDNAIYLYFVLLSICNIDDENICNLGIYFSDEFDNLCKKIREFRHYSTNFIFEYFDGRRKKYIYDFLNNTIEYTDEGIEHYETLLFYEVEDFTLNTDKSLDVKIEDEQKLYLTRDNLPMKIFVVHKNKELEEIVF